jgi:hypothetical protein
MLSENAQLRYEGEDISNSEAADCRKLRQKLDAISVGTDSAETCQAEEKPSSRGWREFGQRQREEMNLYAQN